MRGIDEYKVIVKDRIDEKNKEIRRNRKRVLTVCIPLAVCVVIGASVAVPLMLNGDLSPVGITAKGENPELLNTNGGVMSGDSSDGSSSVWIRELLDGTVTVNTAEDIQRTGVNSAGPVTSENKKNSGTVSSVPFTVTYEDGTSAEFTLTGNILRCETDGTEYVLDDDQLQMLSERISEAEEER